MASNETKVEDKGFLLLADPNLPGRDLPPIEDLFIYVKLNAYTRSRSVIVNDSGKGPSIESDDDPNGTQVNFIATKINYNGDGSVADNGVSYATTDYTEIGGLSLDDKNYGGVVEGFGIKSINITYNSSLVPHVDITFTDLRGASLFDIIDSDNRKSPYSLFFKMPYPVFNLTVKGYYGKPVTYCLHMLKWSSQFNSDSGNFDITAKFVGFQSAFLSDIRMQQVIGVVNTEEGKNRLSKTTITNDGKTSPTPSISDFLNDISKIQIIIKEQNARPGSVILNKDNYDYIIPDIKISKKNDEWIIKNNKMVSPEIKVNKNYTNMSEKNMSEEDKIFIKNSLQEAKLFIKNINYRNDTLLRLAKCIFKKQIKFFSYGIEKLVPMNLKEIAILMNVHESTISRLSNGKYMETPYGVFELKFFFSSSIQNIDGSDFSSKSIKEKIKNIINSENKKSPYSDNKIKDILFKENINLARRTVAKYRESLNFESSSKRKTK